MLVNSTGGIVLYTGWNPEANGVYVVPSIFPRALADDPVEQKNAYRIVAEERTGRKLRASEVSRYWRGEALQWIRANPRAALALGAVKARLFWNAFEAWDIRSVTLSRGMSWVLGAAFVTFGILAPLGLAGLALTAARWRELVPLYLVIGLQFATAVAFIVLSRYRVPAVPALAVFAGAAPIALFDFARARRWTPFALGGAALVAAALAVNLKVPAEDLSMAHFNLGNAYKERGQLAQATEEYFASLETAPGYISTWNNLALVYERNGVERELTIRVWQRVLELARAQGSGMHVERAERHLRAAQLPRGPRRNERARSLERHGRSDRRVRATRSRPRAGTARARSRGSRSRRRRTARRRRGGPSRTRPPLRAAPRRAALRRGTDEQAVPTRGARKRPTVRPVGRDPDRDARRWSGRGWKRASATRKCFPAKLKLAPDHRPSSTASPSSRSSARRARSCSSPNAAHSLCAPPALPSPAPNTSRPFESRSSETVSRASFCGRRRASGVTSAPIRSRSVATAIAARAIQGSTTAGEPGRAM